MLKTTISSQVFDSNKVFVNNKILFANKIVGIESSNKLIEKFIKPKI